MILRIGTSDLKTRHTKDAFSKSVMTTDSLFMPVTKGNLDFLTSRSEGFDI